MKSFIEKITGNNLLFVRIIIFFCFLGHGLVSLNISPGYNLHENIVKSVIPESMDAHTVVVLAGVFDFLMSLLILFNVKLVLVLPVSIGYLLAVGSAGGIFFMEKSGGFFGIAEFFRRVPWIFNLLFLWMALAKGKKIYYLIRIGISFAFIAHGLASVGFLGLNGGHVELATNILSEEAATKFVYYSGFSDLVLGILLLSGIVSRPASIIGLPWLVFIVFLSFLTGLPEGIFRTGFLLTCLYVALDKRCHTWKSENL